jgi:hypothetical protein
MEVRTSRWQSVMMPEELNGVLLPSLERCRRGPRPTEGNPPGLLPAHGVRLMAGWVPMR